MQKFIDTQIKRDENSSKISSVQSNISGTLSSSSNEIFQNLDSCNDQNNLSDPDKCSINTFMRSTSTIGSNLKGNNAMPDLVNDTAGCADCTNIIDNVKDILENPGSGGSGVGNDDDTINDADNLYNNLKLFVQNLSRNSNIPAFNLSTEDINFDPVINFGRVKGSFTDKFMRLAESSMATTYNYNHNPQLNANEQDLTDISFWRGLIGQMIIPELDPNLLTTFRALQAALADFDENMSKEEPDDNEDLISEITTPYGNLKDANNPFTFSAVGYNTVETVATYISDILSDGDLFIRVIKRLTDEIGIISTFKELMNDFNSETETAIEWLLDGYQNITLDTPICRIISNNLEDNCVLDDLLSGLQNNNVNLSQLLATAIAMRVEEIFMHELLKIPYGEVCTHVYSGLHLFTFDADLFETTFYVTTRH